MAEESWLQTARFPELVDHAVAQIREALSWYGRCAGHGLSFPLPYNVPRWTFSYYMYGFSRLTW